MGAIDFFADAARRHDARHVNFFGHYAEPRFNEYFTDEDHLNELGASRFTSELVTACFEGPRLDRAEGEAPASTRSGG